MEPNDQHMVPGDERDKDQNDVDNTDSTRQYTGVLRKGMHVKYKINDDGDDWYKAKLLSRSGKASGKYKNEWNVENDIEGRHVVDFDFVDEWEEDIPSVKESQEEIQIIEIYQTEASQEVVEVKNRELMSFSKHLVYDKLEVQELRESLLKEQDTKATLLKELQATRNQIELMKTEVQRLWEEESLLCHWCNQRQTLSAQNSEVSIMYDTSKESSEIDALEKKRLKDEADMLREEVDTLDTVLIAERQKNQDEQLTMTRVHTEKELQQLRDKTDRNNYNEYYKQEIQSSNEKLDGGTVKLISYEELLSSKNEEIKLIWIKAKEQLADILTKKGA